MHGRRLALLVCSAVVGTGLVWAACSPLVQPSGSSSPGQPATRTAQTAGTRIGLVLPSSPNYDHFEGVAFRNSCYDDKDCHVTGCGSEICSADREVSSACIEYPDKPDGSCGCVKGLCIWYRSGTPEEAAAIAAPTNPPLNVGIQAAPSPTAAKADGGTGGGKSKGGAEQGQPCPDGACAVGLDCITFFGVAGPRGGTFTSCEIRCGGARVCPRGQECV